MGQRGRERIGKNSGEMAAVVRQRNRGEARCSLE
jgi:hypothetical protein